MANQTIPITLTAGPVPPGFEANDINALFDAFCRYVAGAIRADVSFYLEVLIDPTSFITNLIFNSQQRAFKAWDVSIGRYVPLTQFQIGFVINGFVGNDMLSTGWVVLDGRAISAITGISFAQQTALENLFGIGGNLPTVNPTNTQNLPATGSFSGITPAVILPADGAIAALPISAVYDEPEVEALRDATETLRDSTAAAEVQIAAIQAKCEVLLGTLKNSTTPTLYSLVFCGYA